MRGGDEDTLFGRIEFVISVLKSPAVTSTPNFHENISQPFKHQHVLFYIQSLHIYCPGGFGSPYCKLALLAHPLGVLTSVKILLKLVFISAAIFFSASFCSFSISSLWSIMCFCVSRYVC